MAVNGGRHSDWETAYILGATPDWIAEQQERKHHNEALAQSPVRQTDAYPTIPAVHSPRLSCDCCERCPLR